MSSGQYLVTVAPGGDPDAIASAAGMIKDRRLADSPKGTIWLFKLNTSNSSEGRQMINPHEVLARVQKIPGVALAEEDQPIKLVPKIKSK